MTEQWNLQTNIKNKPNAQGTLFSGGKSQMNPEKRYPRGYTPERQRAVNAAVQVNDHTIKEWEPEKNTQRTRGVREQIKRSSVPVGDLQGLRIGIMRPEHPLALDVLKSSNGYYVGLPEGSSPRGEVTLRPEAKGPTVIHEIGHHASHLAGTEHSKARTTRKRGEEEGFADAYADKHMPAYNMGNLSRDRFDAAEMRGRADYQHNYAQATDTWGHRPEMFRRGYESMRPMETRVPNPIDRWRDRNDADRAKRAPKQETLF